MITTPILQVAIDAPLLQLFDYLAPAATAVQVGQRVQVPFRQGQRVGLVVGVVASSTLPAGKLRRATTRLDSAPVVGSDLLDLLRWAWTYYQHPPGEVVAAALPNLLRKGRAPGADASTAEKGSGKVKVKAKPGATVRPNPDHSAAAETPPPLLGPDQASAVAALDAATGYAAFLLQGVTGSGKTEVYLRAIARHLAAGRQTLVLVPEIGLTPQLVERFRRRFPAAGIAVLHSGLTDGERLAGWLEARAGRAGIVIGTRSAVFTPLARPGLIVVDEEHDASLKQHEGFRYSARDVAVWRARQLDVPVVLGSATPSLETMANAAAGRYQRLRLPDRAGGARPPGIHVVDLRRSPVTDGLSAPLTAALRRHLEAGGQALLYLNRRGYAPTLLCPACGRCVECSRCDARPVLHRREGQLVCHHCSTSRRVPTGCAHCGGELFAVGQGTERLEAALTALFPDYPLVRIDRDTTRSRGGIGRLLEEAATGRARILLGTQMLTKGHDFPDVTLVGIVDADQGLFGTDFRASERLAQTFVQVAGRAGRGERSGEVYLQTLVPEHPLLQLLVREGYDAFATAALAERQASGWPPYSHLALLRAEATTRTASLGFLAAARELAATLPAAGVNLLGPAPATMEKRAGRYRAQLLVEASQRRQLQRFLGAWRPRIAELPGAARTRWSLDVDPIDLL